MVESNNCEGGVDGSDAEEHDSVSIGSELNSLFTSVSEKSVSAREPRRLDLVGTSSGLSSNASSSRSISVLLTGLESTNKVLIRRCLGVAGMDGEVVQSKSHEATEEVALATVC